MPEVTTTAVLKLVDPNAHKERKLRETRDTYRRALRAAYEADCRTMSAVNDVVNEYDLTSYAKNALKNYVPQLCGGAHDADELETDQPVRFGSRGFYVDRQPQNHHEWYVKIPHNDDYNLWVPAVPRDNQRALLEALHAGDVTPGEYQLIDRGGDWYLHIPITREVPLQSASDSAERTPVGVDIGATALATVCHRDERGSPTTPEIFTDAGKEIRRLRKRAFTAQRRLQRRGSDRLADDYPSRLWDRIDHIVHRVSRRIVDYAERVSDPVIVLEDLSYIREGMDYGTHMNRRLHKWAFATLHAQIRYKARAAGIPVATVNPRDTSKTCHACGESGTRPHQGTFRCTNADCWVSEYQADVNAALNIADRYPAGESHPRPDKAGGDDSGGDGASLIGPQDSHPEGDPHPTTGDPNAS